MQTRQRPSRLPGTADSRPSLAPGPSGESFALATAAAVLLIALIVGLVLFGGWVAFGVALALMVVGVVAPARYVERISLTRRAAGQVRAAPSMAAREALYLEDESHDELSADDVPLDSPVHRDVARAARDEGHGEG